MPQTGIMSETILFVLVLLPDQTSGHSKAKFATSLLTRKAGGHRPPLHICYLSSSYLLLLPPEHRLACCGSFVDASNASCVRCCLHELGLLDGFLRDGEHGFNECIELLFAFGFGGFD